MTPQQAMSDQEFLALVSRAVDARVAGHLQSSVTLAAEACERRPQEPSAWHTMAMVASDLGQHAEALHCRYRAVQLLDAQATTVGLPAELRQYAQQCLFGYATSLLLAGRWEEAWQYWEAGRLGYSWAPPVGTRYWQGEADGSLLVICEGGYGDLFLFSRFLRPLRSAHVDQHIGLVVQNGLRHFRDWQELGVDVVYELGDTLPLTEWTYATSIMSLPGRLGFNSPASVPPDSFGSFCPPDEREGIGFCWRSEENMTKRRFRSLGCDDADYIGASLRHELGDAVWSLVPDGGGLTPQTEAIKHPRSVLRMEDAIRTWQETAYTISSLSLVVTVDTAVAHLAGLIGVPTLLLLPLNTDWKWQMTGDTTTWYPSVRLFRNQDPMHWDRDGIVAVASRVYKETARA